MTEACSEVNMLLILSSLGAAIHYFVNKNVINFSLKMEKFVKLVVHTGKGSTEVLFFCSFRVGWLSFEEHLQQSSNEHQASFNNFTHIDI